MGPNPIARLKRSAGGGPSAPAAPPWNGGSRLAAGTWVSSLTCQAEGPTASTFRKVRQWFSALPTGSWQSARVASSPAPHRVQAGCGSGRHRAAGGTGPVDDAAVRGSWSKPCVAGPRKSLHVHQSFDRLYASAKARNSDRSSGSLMMRGTLFCPPSLPRLFIQAAKPPGARMSTRAASSPYPSARWAA